MQGRLGTLFEPVRLGEFHADVMADLWQGDAFVRSVQQACALVFKNFSEIWTADLKAMGLKMVEWTPAWQVKRDHIVEDLDVRQMLLGNSNCKALSAMCSIASESSLAVQSVHKDVGSTMHTGVNVLVTLNSDVLPRYCSGSTGKF